MAYTKLVGGKLRNLEEITKIFIRNNVVITRDANGRIATVTIDDGTYSKTLSVTRDGNNKIIGISTSPQD
jgi:hypothetical protein